MATLETSARNAAANGVVDLLDSGSTNSAGKMILKNQSGTQFGAIDLENPAFGASATGVATMNQGSGKSCTTTNAFDFTSSDGTAEFLDRDENVIFTVSLGGTDNSGEIDLDADSGASGDTVSITSFTYTQPAS